MLTILYRLTSNRPAVFRTAARWLVIARLTSFYLGTAVAGDRVALVIGNGEYDPSVEIAQRPNLPNARNDGDAVAKALQDLGFEVLQVTDCTVEKFYEELDKFQGRAKQAQVGLFYYAGHGMEESGQNYLIPVDASLETKAELKTQTVSLEMVLRSMDQAQITTKLVVLDSCRNDPFAGRSWRRSRGSDRGTWPIVDLPNATLLVFSASPGQQANDGTGSNSPFAKAFITEIKVPGVSFMDALLKIAASVKAETGDQEPWIKFEGAIAQFQQSYFVPNPGPFIPAPVPAAAPSEVKKNPANLAGRVQDRNGNPISGAAIHAGGLLEITDSGGYFEFAIPNDRLRPELDLDATASSYLPAHLKVVPNANEMVIQLERAP